MQKAAAEAEAKRQADAALVKAEADRQRAEQEARQKAEVEEVLASHPTVKDAAVVGQRDDLRGEVPIAFVELHEGAAFDETALRAWCRERLAGYKVPREVRLIDKLPRNPTGKILRR